MHKATSGEQALQAEQNSRQRALKFYDRQMRTELSTAMKELIMRQSMVFIATADAEGNCDCSPRFGSPGFIHTLDPKTLIYPEYRGNGVFASLGNILENPHIGMVFIDFLDTTVGLHVNGSAHSYRPEKLPVALKGSIESAALNIDSEVERWVVIGVEEAYIHCSKHVPALSKRDKAIRWGTDDSNMKSENYFLEKKEKA
jgi:predicted pyridoxine 5'-phosphate oxidase superfamily flavin-nucleotide-binding protein